MRNRRTFPTEAKKVSVHGLAGTSRVRFVGTIPHGASTRDVAIDVHPDLIVKIVAALVATKDCACDGEYQRKHRHHSELGWQPGHAMWHVENPDHVMPCIDTLIIDVPVVDPLTEIRGDAHTVLPLLDRNPIGDDDDEP